ncbi:right-handed parallel beta-helix repeat-containing protein [Ancylobacter sp. A5.8]|uniref:NosD domain-containing protein n=1 Tax=Ancylobacter gelatini TaxID=2919920 RepID=UPI001F4EF88B|nr:NosD domain-containing protein [Ancylobacter gelatini]MCJ8145069.1 right-handed parallel beta-helix repeat-containing protein [Ancylobacter gelatini]
MDEDFTCSRRALTASALLLGLAPSAALAASPLFRPDAQNSEEINKLRQTLLAAVDDTPAEPAAGGQTPPDEAKQAVVTAQNTRESQAATQIGSARDLFENAGQTPALSAGEVVFARREQLSWEVADPSAQDHHVTTASGLKLYVLPSGGKHDPRAWNVTDATSYQAMLDKVPAGSCIHNPAEWTIDLTDGLVIGKRLQLEGSGLLRFVAGIERKAAIRITADGTEIRGLRMTNPDKLQSATGGRSYGIEIQANEVLIEGNFIEYFQNAIAVRSNGEFYSTRIIGNRCKDCLGAGKEDRGDGIVTWGAQATIVGNIVNLAEGHDGRVGIHAESLRKYEKTSAPHNDAMITVTGNVIWGQFRRGIVNEGCTGFVASGNVVADATWWAFAIILSRASQVSNNTVIWSRTEADTQGGSWRPQRGPFMLYGSQVGTTISDNSVYLLAGSTARAGICVQGARHWRSLIAKATNNSFVAADTTATMQSGVLLIGGGERVILSGNIFRAPLRTGIHVASPCRVTATDNHLVNMDKIPGSIGILCNRGEPGDYQGNTVDGFSKGIEYSEMPGGSIEGNRILNCDIGIDLDGSTDTTVTGNRFRQTDARIVKAERSEPLVSGNEGQLSVWSGSIPEFSLADAQCHTFTTELAGAAFGDEVTVRYRAGLNGLQMTAEVSAPGTVTVTWCNRTGVAASQPEAVATIELRKVGSYM